METMTTFELIEHVYGLAVAHDCLRGFECGAFIGARIGAMKPGELCTIVMGSETSHVYAGIKQERELYGWETVALTVSKTRNGKQFAVCRIR